MFVCGIDLRLACLLTPMATRAMELAGGSVARFWYSMQNQGQMAED